jgi:hypothetical protein
MHARAAKSGDGATVERRSQTGGSKRSMRTVCGRDVGRRQIVQRTLKIENEVTGKWPSGTRQESEPKVPRWFRLREVDIPCRELAGDAMLGKANDWVDMVYQGLWETAVLTCQFCPSHYPQVLD